jgi:hypothetical protein
LRRAYTAEQPSRLSIAEWGEMFTVWNDIEALQIEVRDGIVERRRDLRSTCSSVGATLGRRGRILRVCNEIEALKIVVKEGIDEHRMKF